tara:strand:+ start:11516 stop:12940 length:1425 start_codon:yes stop_codon:yes gene_type:complete
MEDIKLNKVVVEGKQNQSISLNLEGELSRYVDSKLKDFIREYSSNQKPIQVNFRELVSWVPYSDSYTHYIHKYPAKLLKHIPIFFLNSKILNGNDNATVLDPFCGSGTVLLESILNGFDAIGCDANPLARLIASVKTTPLDPESLNRYLKSIVKRAKQFRKYDKKNIVNVDHWFPLDTQVNLSKIHRAIKEVSNKQERDFLLVTFSNIVKKSSFADPNLSVPVKIKPEKYLNLDLKNKLEEQVKQIETLDIYKVFNEQLKKNIQRIKLIHDKEINNTASIVSCDARKITKDLNTEIEMYASNSVDFILTSPPYAGAQKYIRSSSLNLGWLEYCEDKPLRFYEKQNIGREHYTKGEYSKCLKVGVDCIDEMLLKIWNLNPLRAHINGNFLLEMESAIKEMYRVLKLGSNAVIVIGNNEVCGLNFETHKYLTAIAKRIGFKLELVMIDDIHSRGLMTKRNKTASIINSEWILVFKK